MRPFSLRTQFVVTLVGCVLNAVSLAAMTYYPELGSIAWVIAPLCVPGSVLCLSAWRSPYPWIARVGLLGGLWAILCLPAFFM